MDKLVEKDLKYIWHPCSQMKDYEDLPSIIIKRGRGVYVYDTDGKKYLDIISSWWCNLLGHCNEKVSTAIKNQLDELEHVIFSNFSHEPAIKLCEELSKLLPSKLTKFHFSDNGSASIECALKMSLQYHNQTKNPQKIKFMCLSDGYHGETIGALSVGGIDLYSKIYDPMLMKEVVRIEAPDCYRCPYKKSRDCCDIECFCKVTQAFDKFAHETCALIVEPLLQGSAGMRIYPANYLKKLREICNQYNVIFIADEIATGFGRTGKMFACDHAQISPDIMCLSKGLTGGYLPMSITATSQKIYDAFYDDYLKGKAFMHSHTYSGNPLGCAAALAVLKIIQEEDILEKAQRIGSWLHESLLKTFQEHPNVGEIRHIGLINAIELVQDFRTKQKFNPKLRVGYQIYKEALKLGLILRPLGDVIYFNPPLNITRSELNEAIDLCKKAVEKVLRLN